MFDDGQVRRLSETDGCDSGDTFVIETSLSGSDSLEKEDADFDVASYSSSAGLPIGAICNVQTISSRIEVLLQIVQFGTPQEGLAASQDQLSADQLADLLSVEFNHECAAASGGCSYNEETRCPAIQLSTEWTPESATYAPRCPSPLRDVPAGMAAMP